MVNTKSAITDLIGTSPMRLFPILLPQGQSTFPAMTYSTVSLVGNPSFDGASELDHLSVDFHAYANSILTIDDLLTTFRTELEDTRGTFNGVNIRNVRFYESGSDDYLDTIEKKTRQIEMRISYLR